MDSGEHKPDNERMSEVAPLAAAPRLPRASVGVPAPVPPRASGKVPVEMFIAFKLVNADPSPVKLPRNELVGFLKNTKPEYVPASWEFGNAPLRPAKLMLLRPEPTPLKYPTKL